MEYIISEREKRTQRNPFYQFWRFVCLSLRFMKLSCACCGLPPAEREGKLPRRTEGDSPR